jgi:hypothetical protein
MISFRQFARAGALASVIALVIGGAIMLMLLAVGILNSELYGRLTETYAPTAPFSKADDDPLIRLVLYRVIPDENAVEASLLLIVDAESKLGEDIKGSGSSVKAIVEDGSSSHLYAMTAETTVMDASTFRHGFASAIVRSDRFFLPIYPSMGSYPFDDLRMRPMFRMQVDQSSILAFKVEVQKAFPGRLLSVEGDSGITLVSLARTPPEKAFIVTASAIFFLLSLTVTIGLFASRRGLTSFEQLIAVAGYLLAAAGFRDLLGVSRVAGTTILEIVILGIPLVLLSFGVAISMYRGRRSSSDEASTESGGSSAA